MEEGPVMPMAPRNPVPCTSRARLTCLTMQHGFSQCAALCAHLLHDGTHAPGSALQGSEVGCGCVRGGWRQR